MTAGGAAQPGRDAAPARVTVVVNGDERAIAPGTTIAALLAELDLDPRGLAVAVDGEVVTRRLWDAHALGGGEHVEVLSIAQGG